jgi:hypothetical protein
MTISSPAIAITDAIDAAIPSMVTVFFAAWRKHVVDGKSGWDVTAVR